jgi:hypothetical protein
MFYLQCLNRTATLSLQLHLVFVVSPILHKYDNHILTYDGIATKFFHQITSEL